VQCKGARTPCHNREVQRQQLLVLYTANSSPTSAVTAWSFFDGTARSNAMAGDGAAPPYASVLAAMQDGWRVLQLPPLGAAAAGQEHDTAFLRHEFVLEKLVDG
jgi:hypothetical protein